MLLGLQFTNESCYQKKGDQLVSKPKELGELLKKTILPKISCFRKSGDVVVDKTETKSETGKSVGRKDSKEAIIDIHIVKSSTEVSATQKLDPIKPKSFTPKSLLASKLSCFQKKDEKPDLGPKITSGEIQNIASEETLKQDILSNKQPQTDEQKGPQQLKNLLKKNLSCFHKKDKDQKGKDDIPTLRISQSVEIPQEIKPMLTYHTSDKENPELMNITEKYAPLAEAEDFSFYGSDSKVGKNVGDVDNLFGYKISEEYSKQDISDDYLQSKMKNFEFGVRWSMMTDVVNSGIRSIVSDQERQLQEAMFELISSEARYYTGLEVIMNHYYKSYLFSPINDNSGYVNPIDKHHVFSNITDILETSKKLLADFELRWKEDRPFLHDVCDILLEHACSSGFKQYVAYLRNQSFQQDAFARLLESTIVKKELMRLQSFGSSKGLSLDSYLLLPMQRLTRYKLLVNNILRILMHNTFDKEVFKSQIENAKRASQQISHLLQLSNSGKAELDNKALLIDLLNKIDFPIDCKMLSFNGKILLKEGEYNMDSCPQKHGNPLKRKSTHYILLLFNDIMMIGKRSGSRIHILDYCARKDVIFTARVNQILNKPKKGKNVLHVNDYKPETGLRFYIKFENSCNSYLREPIILQVKNSEEIESWQKYLPDHCNKEIFDYLSYNNYIYWNTIKQLQLYSSL